jgi:hypothetical protein
MVGYPEQPSGEFRGGFVCGARTVNPQKNFLAEFFRNCLIVNHTVNKADYGGTVLFEQHTKALVIAVPDPEHQLGVLIER